KTLKKKKVLLKLNIKLLNSVKFKQFCVKYLQFILKIKMMIYLNPINKLIIFISKLSYMKNMIFINIKNFSLNMKKLKKELKNSNIKIEIASSNLNYSNTNITSYNL